MKVFLAIFITIVGTFAVLDPNSFVESWQNGPLHFLRQVGEMLFGAAVLYWLIELIKLIKAVSIRLYAEIVCFIITVHAVLDRAAFLASLKDPAELAGKLVGIFFAAMLFYFFVLGVTIIWSRAEELYYITSSEKRLFASLAVVSLLWAFIRGTIDSSTALGGILVLIALSVFVVFLCWRGLLAIYHRISYGDLDFALSNTEFLLILLPSCSLALAIFLPDYLKDRQKGPLIKNAFDLFAVVYPLVAVTIVAAMVFYWFYFGFKVLFRAIKYKGITFERTGQGFKYHGLTRDIVLNWSDIISIDLTDAPYAGLPLINIYRPLREPVLKVMTSQRRKPVILRGNNLEKILILILQERSCWASPAAGMAKESGNCL